MRIAIGRGSRLFQELMSHYFRYHCRSNCKSQIKLGVRYSLFAMLLNIITSLMYRPTMTSVRVASKAIARLLRVDCRRYYFFTASNSVVGRPGEVAAVVRVRSFTSSISLRDVSGRLRPSSSSLSLDSAIYQNPDVVRGHLKSRSKNVELNIIDALLNLKESRNNLISKGNALRSQKKTLSATIGKLMKEKASSDIILDHKSQVESITSESISLDKKLAEIEISMKNMQMMIPNLLDDR